MVLPTSPQEAQSAWNYTTQMLQLQKLVMNKKSVVRAVIPSNLNKIYDEIQKHFKMSFFKPILLLFIKPGLLFIHEVATICFFKEISVKI